MSNVEFHLIESVCISAAGQLVLILSGLAFMVFMVFLSLMDILNVLLGT